MIQKFECKLNFNIWKASSRRIIEKLLNTISKFKELDILKLEAPIKLFKSHIFDIKSII